jgi:pyruvate formate lyase activating enzyme
MQKIKDMGFQIGVHTEGAYPQGLLRVLPYIDWVGLDIKALPEDYDTVTRTKNSFGQAERSLDILINSDIDFEVRTTIYKGSPQGNNIFKIAKYLLDKGVYDRWHIQIARGDYPTWDEPLPDIDIRW